MHPSFGRHNDKTMLPKSQRLNLKKDFKWVRSGKELNTKYLRLFVRLGQNETPLVGIASSSKTFKEAVDRNRARRLTSAALEVLYPRLEKRVNLIALPKSAILGVKSGDVLLELEETLKNAKILS